MKIEDKVGYVGFAICLFILMIGLVANLFNYHL